MKHLFLHVGMHKTGTSSIQVTFHRNAALLAEHGIHYFPAKANHSGLMIRGFSRDPARQGRLSATQEAERQRAEEVRVAILDFLRSRDAGCFVISGEGMERLDAASVRDMLGFLRPLVDRLTVVSFVRPQRTAIPSLVSQRLGGGLTPEGVEAVCPIYRRALEKFLLCADLAGMRLPIYDRATLERGCSIATMLAVCGAPPELYDRLEQVRLNTALSRPAVALLFAANDSPDASAPRRDGRLPLVRLLRRLTGPRFAIPDAVLDHILCEPAVREGAAWMEGVLGRSFAEFAAPVPAAPAPDAPRPGAWVRSAMATLSRAEVAALAALLRADGRPALAAPLAGLEARLAAAPGAEDAPLLDWQGMQAVMVELSDALGGPKLPGAAAPRRRARRAAPDQPRQPNPAKVAQRLERRAARRAARLERRRDAAATETSP